MNAIARRECGLPVRSLLPGYKTDVRQFNDWLGDVVVNRKNQGELLVGYFRELQDRGMRPATLGRKKVAIKKALEAKWKKDGLSVAEQEAIDIFFRKTLRVPRGDEAKDDFLTREEMSELVTLSPPKTAIIIEALFQSGCRVSELMNVKLADCTPSADAMTVRVMGKGKKERNIFLRHSTFQRVRELYPGKTFLFEYDGKPISRGCVYAMVRRAGKKIGRGVTMKDGTRTKPLHPHLMRHSLATALIGPLGVQKVSAYLGHSSSVVTLRYYVHGRPSSSEILGATVLGIA